MIKDTYSFKKYSVGNHDYRKTPNLCKGLLILLTRQEVQVNELCHVHSN